MLELKLSLVSTSIQTHQVILQCHQRTSQCWPSDLWFQSDGVQQTTYLAQHYCQEAIRQISMLRPSPERDALIRLTEMVLTRDKWSRSCPGLTSGSYYWACKPGLGPAPPPSIATHVCARQRVGHWGVRDHRSLSWGWTSSVLVLIMGAAEPQWVQNQSGTWRPSWIDSLDTSPLPRPKVIQVISV